MLQTKLKINEPGDRYEQEADLIADRVMRMPEPSIQRQMEPEEEEDEEGMVQRKAIANQITPLQVLPDIEDEEDEEEGIAQRKEIANQVAPLAQEQESSEVPPIVHEVLNSPSQPLDSETRTFMESRFGHDFSQVRVHTNTRATESVRAVSALAYTVGRDVVFGSGQYAPETTEGKRLLAHELTHVVQQTGRGYNASSAQIQCLTTKEHQEIGDEAYELVKQGFTPETLKQSPLANILRRGSRFSLGKKVKTYGDISADPDYFATFEELIQREGERPGEVGQGVLAARNMTHFTPDNIRLWKELHDVAVDEMLFAHRQLEFVFTWLRGLDLLLEQARAATLKGDEDRADRLIAKFERRFQAQEKRMDTIANKAHQVARQALMRNAFADHFLTDAFSAGHIVTPRAEILQEAGVRLEKPVSGWTLVRIYLRFGTWKESGELRAQARSLAWHDLDNYFGVEVRNAAPGFGSWIACGDSCSKRTGDSHWNATRAMAFRGISESIKHLWMAGLTGTRPTDYRSVLDLIPRPTWSKYPGWGKTEWQNQLRHIRGENVPHVTGDNLHRFVEYLLPIEHCTETEMDPGCWRPFILTSKDWIRHYSFDSWVRPWIAKIQAQAAERYRFL